MGSLTRNDKDFIEVRIATAQSEIEKVVATLGRIQREILNPLREILIKSMEEKK